MPYQITIAEPFVAQHYLTVPDAGSEGDIHSHSFIAEVTFEGTTLNEYGYLLDIDIVKDSLSCIIQEYRDTTLNERLDGNPSCERLAKSIHDSLRSDTELSGVDTLTVRVHEDETAIVSYSSPV